MPAIQDEIAKKVHEFLIEEVIEDADEDDFELGFDENLLTDVGIDSMGMLRMVGFIESEYDISISPAFFTIENFKSVATISVFVSTLIAENS